MGTASPIPFANKIHIKVPTTFRRTFFSMCPEPSGHRYRPIFRSRSQFDKPFGSLLFFPWSWLVISWLSMSTKNLFKWWKLITAQIKTPVSFDIKILLSLTNIKVFKSIKKNICGKTESDLFKYVWRVYNRRVPSVQHMSSTQKGHSFSAPKISQFHTKNPSVQHTPQFHTKKTLCSTPKTPVFQPRVPHQKLLGSTPSSTPKTLQFHTKKSSVQHTPQTKTVLNWGVFAVELREVELRGFDVELRGFWC